MMKLTTKKPLRFLAALMVVVLLVTCIPLNVFGANEELLPFDTQTTENTVGGASGISENDNVSVIDGNVIGEYVEDISKREENVKHFANPDGTYTAIVYPTAVHRKDSDGVWQDINNDLAITTVKGGEKYASADSRVSFASRFAPSAELMTLSENGYSISMSLISDSKNESVMRASTESFGLASVTNAAKKELPKTDVKLEDVARVDNRSSIVYNNVRANTDIEYILDGNSVKENIIVKAASNSYEYTFDLRLDGLVAVLNENGSISVNDAETGEAKYLIPAPYMYDASGAVSYAVEYTLIAVSSGRYLLMVTADKTWINAKDREFPVTIDPTIVPDTMMSDTYVSQYSPNTSYFYTPDLLVGDGFTALMHLDFPSLPSGSILNEVYLYMNYYFESSPADAISVGTYQITSSWNEEFATYNNMPTISSQVLSTTTLYGDMGTSSSPYMVQMSITDAAKDWFYNDSENYGIAIKYEAGVGTARIKSYDSGYNTCEFISITYSPYIVGVPTNLRSNDTHECIPCAITNVAAYWCIMKGYSQFNCATALKQEEQAILVQKKMRTQCSCSNMETCDCEYVKYYAENGSTHTGGHNYNSNIPFGFSIFSHSAGSTTYTLQATVMNNSHSQFGWNTLVNEINEGRPIMLGFAAVTGSPYFSHMTVCVGYEIVNNKKYVYVVDAHTSGYVKQEFSTVYNDFMITVNIVAS